MAHTISESWRNSAEPVPVAEAETGPCFATDEAAGSVVTLTGVRGTVWPSLEKLVSGRATPGR